MEPRNLATSVRSASIPFRSASQGKQFVQRELERSGDFLEAK